MTSPSRTIGWEIIKYQLDFFSVKERGMERVTALLSWKGLCSCKCNKMQWEQQHSRSTTQQLLPHIQNSFKKLHKTKTGLHKVPEGQSPIGHRGWIVCHVTLCSDSSHSSSATDGLNVFWFLGFSTETFLRRERFFHQYRIWVGRLRNELICNWLDPVEDDLQFPQLPGKK